MENLLFIYIYVCGIFSTSMAMYLAMGKNINKMNKLGIVIFSFFHPITILIVALVSLIKCFLLQGEK